MDRREEVDDERDLRVWLGSWVCLRRVDVAGAAIACDLETSVETSTVIVTEGSSGGESRSSGLPIGDALFGS